MQSSAIGVSLSTGAALRCLILLSLTSLLCVADFGLMGAEKSADGDEGNFVWPESFEFDCAADGGALIAYDNNLLTGDDGRKGNLVFFAAAEIECWQL